MLVTLYQRYSKFQRYPVTMLLPALLRYHSSHLQRYSYVVQLYAPYPFTRLTALLSSCSILLPRPSLFLQPHFISLSLRLVQVGKHSFAYTLVADSHVRVDDSVLVERHMCVLDIDQLANNRTNAQHRHFFVFENVACNAQPQDFPFPVNFSNSFSAAPILSLMSLPCKDQSISSMCLRF